MNGTHVPARVNDVCDYIILMRCSGEEMLNLPKLQKLLYYVQAWNLAFTEETLFDGKFQAWIHGPVNREIFDRFAGQKTLYSPVDVSDITPGFNPDTALSADDRLHIDNVLEVYAKFGGSELEAQAHVEEPWIRARGDCTPTSRCEAVLDERFMGEYYKARLTAG
jgi:uncharacterized phage-associated protein